MSHECSNCELKSQSKQVVDIACIQVWYCQKCDSLDLEVYKPISNLYQEIQKWVYYHYM